ncbi:glycoside hydrolase family 125 protein [Lactobacillus sp. YT155]|uniref:glycoside hydrolase family 125 protein n=1 Tax=Lactobacillus sp. YT155 TaxID=3060955 RepID=UPI00265F7651|nr:glycoside hydrolase family 125 protein [Lactobacillus sp. YT155]MDO1605853.1 glycoside hydrolase family 125 protein [Lactobacillus sp. YT155]
MVNKYTKEQISNLVKSKYAKHPKIVSMFENCFKNTLESTITFNSDGTTAFMITGDIPAMWLRDSTNQLRPYLFTATTDENLKLTILKVLKKQFECILLDPYANAFNNEANGKGHQTDFTEMKPSIWERKYEIDSLCYPLQLSYLLWKNVGVTNQFDSQFLEVLKKVIEVWEIEQNHKKNSKYTFERLNGIESDTLAFDGKGTEVAETGMTWSGFRPSDDACRFGYLVPSNMFAVVVLNYSVEILYDFFSEQKELIARILHLKAKIEVGIDKYGKVNTEKFGDLYAYEVDGLGRYNLMDDANVPSLLSIPYLGFSADKKVYENTRNFVLSKNNPYYFEGEIAKGIGSQHTPKNYIWHIALAIQGLTSNKNDEIERIISYFENTDAGTNLVHEGFNKDNPSLYTREWFSWSNAVFVEFILSTIGIELTY